VSNATFSVIRDILGWFSAGDLDLVRQGHRSENGVYLGNGEELNMRYSNHYCSP
jgi:hypothetical protein